ncbi:MAG TPA: hypothetical protein PLA54_11070 [Spirochaetota bacterium]|nr:hypothetical protein [Spirochaetota bacterium]
MNADMIKAITFSNNPIVIVIKNVSMNFVVAKLMFNESVNEPIEIISTEKVPIIKCAGISMELIMYPIINDLNKIELSLIVLYLCVRGNSVKKMKKTNIPNCIGI